MNIGWQRERPTKSKSVAAVDGGSGYSGDKAPGMGELARRLQAAIVAGVDSFYLRHYRSYVLPVDLLDRFADMVAPEVADGSDTNRTRSVAVPRSRAVTDGGG